jgi:hypothetical protein
LRFHKAAASGGGDGGHWPPLYDFQWSDHDAIVIVGVNRFGATCPIAARCHGD